MDFEPYRGIYSPYEPFYTVNRAKKRPAWVSRRSKFGITPYY